jgi:hypothetical protein
MISLSDAIERAKLAADNSGLLSAYTYDQLVDQLDFSDKHSFTMGLVDLGIVTKHGSYEGEEHIASVLDHDYRDEDEYDEKAVERQSSIIEEFVKVAQQFVQSPGGLWTPSSWDEDETDEDAAEFDSYLDAPVDDFKSVQTHDDMPEREFDIEQIEQLQEVLEKNGISVDKDGNVKQFKSNMPGIYVKEIPLKPIPLDQAIERFTGEAEAVQKEQERVKGLQDILASLNRDFVGIGSASQDLLKKFDDSMVNLEKFRYSEQSKDENVRSIAQGLGSVRKYLTESTEPLDDLQHGLKEYSDTIQGLQGRLDNYYQSQYEKTDAKFEVVDALGRLKEMMEKDPESFNKAVSGLGGISASFREVVASMWNSKQSAFGDEHGIMDEAEVSGSAEVMIGEDYILNFFEQKVGDPTLAENLYDVFTDLMASNGQITKHDFPVMFDELQNILGIERDHITVKIIQGSGVSAQVALDQDIRGEADTGTPDGRYSGEFEEVDSQIIEQIKSLLDEDLGYAIEDTLIPELEV